MAIYKKNKDGLAAAGFLTPTLIIFGTFILFPVFFSFYLSFQDWNAFSWEGSFVGLDNYTRMVHTKEIGRAHV